MRSLIFKILHCMGRPDCRSSSSFHATALEARYAATKEADANPISAGDCNHVKNGILSQNFCVKVSIGQVTMYCAL
jgi:hypothetical protein